MDTYVVETRVRFEGSAQERLAGAPHRLESNDQVLDEPPVVVHEEGADGLALVQFTIAADSEVKAQKTALDVARDALELQDDDDERVADLQVSARRLEPQSQ